ncbi:uncharacterized protein LOC134269903 [Saccostrea cucullata]|uniref:uncharacterized protein LOC134269903 n=1 Tax=Saccostrea cuccullata TaxID=36930 RepID=UPI002ED2B8D7
MGNQMLSTIWIVSCMILLTTYIQGTVAVGCTSNDVWTCSTTYNSAIRAAGNDIEKMCSETRQFLDCLDKVLAACGTDSSSLESAKEYVNQARKAINQSACGAAGLFFNLMVMVFGLALTYIMKKFND